MRARTRSTFVIIQSLWYMYCTQASFANVDTDITYSRSEIAIQLRLQYLMGPFKYGWFCYGFEKLRLLSINVKCIEYFIRMITGIPIN